MSSPSKSKGRIQKQLTSSGPTMPSRTSNVLPPKKSPITTHENPPVFSGHESLSGYRSLPARASYPKKEKLLIINPNTSRVMTDLIYDMLLSRGGSIYNIQMYTARKGPASINNDDDCHASSEFVMEELEVLLKSDKFDAFLVACYSVHPLVSKLKDMVPPSAHVIGIFEASVTTAISLLPKRNETFGIVSTGSIWETLLTAGVKDFLGGNKKFQGVETTGLTAVELHETHPDVVKERVMEATKRLVRNRNCTVVCLGCAGMVDMEEIVREAIVQELGHEASEYVRIVDPIRAGVACLESMGLTIPSRS